MPGAAAWAGATGQLAWIDLEVLSCNVPAVNLYRQAGFRTLGQFADMFRIDGESHGYTLMSLPLASHA